MMRGFAVRAMPAVLAATALVLSACTSDAEPARAAPSDGDSTVSESSTKQPTYSPEPGEVMTLPQDQRWATLERGRYAVQVTPSLSYEVSVPDGWRVFEGRFLNSPPAESGNSMVFVARAPKGDTWVPAHPCLDHSEMAVGPTAGDLARALRHQPVLNVSKAQPISPDGNRGWCVDVSIPETVEAGACIDGRVALFSGASEEWGGEGGFAGRWWIIVVDGKRLVVNAQCVNDCTKYDWRTLQPMIEYMTFTHTG